MVELAVRVPEPAPAPVLRISRRIDWPALAAWALAFVLVTYLSLRGGGYDIVARSQVGVAVWWIVWLGALAGLLPTRFGARGWVAVALLGGFAAWTGLAVSWTSERRADGHRAWPDRRLSGRARAGDRAAGAHGSPSHDQRNGQRDRPGYRAGRALAASSASLSGQPGLPVPRPDERSQAELPPRLLERAGRLRRDGLPVTTGRRRGRPHAPGPGARRGHAAARSQCVCT